MPSFIHSHSVYLCGYVYIGIQVKCTYIPPGPPSLATTRLRKTEGPPALPLTPLTTDMWVQGQVGPGCQVRWVHHY